jgi:multiple sugar transport system substrate-binding protein
MTRRCFTHLLLLLVPALLALAGSSGCSPVSARPEGRRPVTLRYAYWGALYEIKVWEELARRFNERQDRIRIKLEHIAGLAYHPKLLAMHVGRCAPDVMAVDDEPFPELAENHVFEDLGPWIARDPGVRMEDYYPQFTNAWQHRKTQYAIPYLGHCLLIYYNRAHLRSAGLPDPPADWDWNEFLRYAKTLTRDLDSDGRADRFGFMRPFNLFHSLPWIWSAGGNEMDPALTRCELNTPEAIRGIDFAYSLIHRERVTPLMTELPGMPLENMFLTGRISMVVHGPWWLENCRREPNLEWDVQHFPRGPAGRSTRTTCEGLAMSASTKHKQEAWEWIRFVSGREGQEIIARSERGIAANPAVARRFFPKPETPQHEERFLEAMRYARVQRIPVQFNENAMVINREWDLMLLGRRTPEQVAANIQKGVNKIMAEPR